MIAPVRNGYAQRVTGSRVAAGARNVAKMSGTPGIESAAKSKRTGAQEESLLREGAEDIGSESDSGNSGHNGKRGQTPSKFTASLIDDSLAWNERLRATTDAYRYTLDNLDTDSSRLKPGGVYDAPS